MSPNIPPVFEALPAEVLGNILRQMTSPDDLYSTIRASPNAFGSFRCFREAILIEVLQAHLPAEIFAEYLGLLHIPKYEDFNHVPARSKFEYLFQVNESKEQAWESCRYFAWRGFLEAFFEQHFANVRAAKLSGIQEYIAPQPAQKRQINYIISMYGTLKRFIRDYQSFVRSILTGNPPPLSDLDPSFRRREIDSPQCWPPLNEVEALRLQRGFLRYELCSRARAIPAWNGNMPLTPLNGDAHDVLSHTISIYLPRWEEEEIRCVWTYVYRQYQILFLGVLNEFRFDIRRLSQKARHAPDNEVILAPEMSNIFWKRIGSWAYEMSNLGLPMLQQVLRSDFNDQMRFLKNTAFDLFPRPRGGISLLFDDNSLADEWDDDLTLIDLRMANGVSHIYALVIENMRDWLEDDDSELDKLCAAEAALKDIGWIFWEDLRRLKYLGWPSLDLEVPDYLSRLGHHFPLNRFEVEDKYPERSMYVTRDDLRGELSAKYPVSPPTADGACFVIERIRDISIWSSKEVSPAFQEICSGLSTSG